MTERHVLDNWKEIASYLGRTGKTCRNWEKEYGLPVHRLDGSSRAHVFAYPDEIDKWKEEMLREEKSAAEMARGYKRGSSAGLERREIVKSNLKKLYIPSAIGLLVIAAGLAVYYKSRGPHYDPKRIIVAVFENQTGDKTQDVLGRIASDWITQGLSRAGIAELVEVPPGKSTPGTAEENERIHALAREAGAGTLVTGAYFLQGKTLSFHARVSDMSNGKVIKALDPVSAPFEDPIKAIDLMRQKVLGGLAEISDLKARPVLPFLGQPPTFEAYKEYAAGREAFLRGDWMGAIEHCLRATELDPSYKSPVLQAATAYFNLGRYGAAQKLLDEVDKARESLSPLDQASLDYRKALYQGDLAGQLRVSRQWAPRLKGIWLYQWGYVAVKNNCPREAVKALSMLDPEGISAKDWPYYWLVMTQAQHMLGRYRTELKWARRGRRKFPENSYLFQSELRALAALGRIEEIDRLVDQSLSTQFSKRGLFGSDLSYAPGWLMSDTGRVLRVHGFKTECFRLLDRALRWMQERPDEEKTKPAYRQIMGFAHYCAEKWPEAQVFYGGLLKEDPENLWYLRYCGDIAARRGEREDALRISKQLEELKKPYLWGAPSYHRACIAAVLGEKETAVLLLREAISQGMQYFDFWDDMDLESLHNYPPFKELIRPKG